MAGLPALDTAVSATQSPTEFPTARTVRPRMAGEWERAQNNTCCHRQYIIVITTVLSYCKDGGGFAVKLSNPLTRSSEYMESMHCNWYTVTS